MAMVLQLVAAVCPVRVCMAASHLISKMISLYLYETNGWKSASGSNLGVLGPPGGGAGERFPMNVNAPSRSAPPLISSPFIVIFTFPALGLSFSVTRAFAHVVGQRTLEALVFPM